MAGACPPRAAQCNGCHAILSFYQGHARARSAPAAKSASITATCPPTAAALRKIFAGYPASLAPGSRKKADPVALKSISVGNRGRSTDPAARYSGPNSKHHSKPPERAPTIAAASKKIPGPRAVCGPTRAAREAIFRAHSAVDFLRDECSESNCDHDVAWRPNIVRWKPQRSMYGSSTSKARGRTSKGDWPISDDVPSCLGNVFRLQLAPQLSGKCASYAFSPPAFWEVHFVQQPSPLHVCIRRMRRATCARDKVAARALAVRRGPTPPASRRLCALWLGGVAPPPPPPPRVSAHPLCLVSPCAAVWHQPLCWRARCEGRRVVCREPLCATECAHATLAVPCHFWLLTCVRLPGW